MIKLIPNRTTGLQKKVIEDKNTSVACVHCNGQGHHKMNVAASAFKNLKVSASTIEFENDCEHCDGTGHVRTQVRIIKRNQITAIV
jgi:DnaJ-class molecular chaperone